MPVYEYRCNDCRSTFDVLRRMGDRELATVCPHCESLASMPLISRIAGLRPVAAGGGGDATPLSGGGGGGCCGGSCGRG